MTKFRCLIILDDDDDRITGLTVCGKSVLDVSAVTPRLDQTTCPLCLNALDEQAARAKAREQAEDRDDPFWAKVDSDYDEWRDQ